MMQRLLLAFQFAERAHRGQVRKYTGEPYIAHPIEVSQLVAAATGSEDAAIAGLLHDVVEDCDVSLAQINKAFGEHVAKLVHEVTDISRKEHGNRETRKALDRQHLALASPLGKSIKLADLISNTQSITQHDPNFAKVYMVEKALLLPLLVEGDAGLYTRAKGLLDAYQQSQAAAMSDDLAKSVTDQLIRREYARQERVIEEALILGAFPWDLSIRISWPRGGQRAWELA